MCTWGLMYFWWQKPGVAWRKGAWRHLPWMSRVGREGSGPAWWEGGGVASMSACPPVPAHRGAYESGREFLEDNLSLSWPVQSRTTTACQNGFNWWMIMLRIGGKRGGEIRGLGVLLTEKEKVSCFWCKWRNAVPKRRSCPGSRVACRQNTTRMF